MTFSPKSARSCVHCSSFERCCRYFFTVCVQCPGTPPSFLRAKGRSHATLRMPHRKYPHFVSERNVVDVIARLLEASLARPFAMMTVAV